ncbi:hypothetical protein [Flavobacterium sp.]|uniref:hypothetical protein n=1 Tax=Flavobacterium sp. TaxID=239 RepID=UPI0012249C9A|nr:hypothetical protein [Flavobacterium sp.]RZJ70698.1 MAG: hypothetical protein EOO49_12655 [Flavobacterium sp.]
MRKLIPCEWLALDGFASDKNGTTAFFENPKYGKGSDQDMLGILKNVDTILIGRKTYEMFVNF